VHQREARIGGTDVADKTDTANTIGAQTVGRDAIFD
jgi:hypothetical protein